MKVCLRDTKQYPGDSEDSSVKRHKKRDAKDIKINRMNRHQLDIDIPRRWNI